MWVGIADKGTDRAGQPGLFQEPGGLQTSTRATGPNGTPLRLAPSRRDDSG